ncbi:hypothetical protein ANCCAN_25459 [Ancylostoma caninum]|uniref:Uncharacterized protein n=1 Tax=Ancylostoma caninum TaxID=29170 RepID=A0A368FDB6_ANCCA|nr:hypothetical protein ANCCAN_25459 [Ancylostoma caninum]
MSVDGSGSHSGRKRKVTYVEEEDWGDDVSVLSRDDKSSVGTIILKILLGLIFIGSATGAIVYAVINSEESQNQPIDENATLYFPYDIDQQCFNGTLTMQYRVGVVDGQEQYTVRHYNRSCFFAPSKLMGLTYIRKKRDEKVSLNGHFKEVIVYEGEPPEDVTVNGRHPSLIRGYSSEQRNVTYGWELFFSHSTNFSLYTEEYWYPSMKSTKPDWSIFNDIPNSCLDS